MSKDRNLKQGINEYYFQIGEDYLDVDINRLEGYLELKIETTDSFPIESEEQINEICKKLKQLLKQAQNKL